MKPLLTLLAIWLLGIGVCACGAAHKNTTASSSSASHRRDANDPDFDGNDNYDEGEVRAVGYEAGAATKLAITGVVKRYYTAAVTGNGDRACSLLSASLAKAVPNEFRSVPTLKNLKTCAAIVSRLYKIRPQAQEVASSLATFRVTGVRLNGNYAITLLLFQPMFERYITMHREGGAWKITELLDSAMP
jgi:hypothetical protein